MRFYLTTPTDAEVEAGLISPGYPIDTSASGSVDVVIIDPMWNGLGESLRMAALADTFQVNVASHLYTGTLATAMCAQFCAAIPNLRIMELDVDRAPGLDELFTGEVTVKDGNVILPAGPGWGVVPREARLTRLA